MADTLDKQKSPEQTRTPDGVMANNSDASHNLYEAKLNWIGARIEHAREEGILEADREWAPVLAEWNQGMQAWRDAQRERNALSETERRGPKGNEANTKIDALRDGQIDGHARQYSPEDLWLAAEVRGTADEVRVDRAMRENKKEQEEIRTPEAPTPPTPPAQPPQTQERIASSYKRIDT
jgi:hypothetical protein